MRAVHLTGVCRTDCGEVHEFAEALALNDSHPLVVAVCFAHRHGLDPHLAVARQALFAQVQWTRKLAPAAFDSAVREFAAATDQLSHLDTWDSAELWSATFRIDQFWSDREQFAPGRSGKLFWEPE